MATLPQVSTTKPIPSRLGGPGVSGRILFREWALRPFDGSLQATPLPFSDAARDLRQFCLRDATQTGRKGSSTPIWRVCFWRVDREQAGFGERFGKVPSDPPRSHSP
jgi:hypothetical protein